MYLGKAPLVGQSLRLDFLKMRKFLDWQVQKAPANWVPYQDFDAVVQDVDQGLDADRHYARVTVVSVDALTVKTTSGRSNTVVHPEGEIVVSPLANNSLWSNVSVLPSVLNLKNVFVAIKT
jgi:hypothetical protein